MKTFKTLNLMAVMAFAATTVFAQTTTADKPASSGSMQSGSMMSPDVENQDYSAWKDYFRKRRYAPIAPAKGMMMDMPEFKDVYDEKTFKYLMRITSEENQIPRRPFDAPVPIASYDRYFKLLETKANTYRRELIRENEASMKMMGSMSGSMGKPMEKPMDR